MRCSGSANPRAARWVTSECRIRCDYYAEVDDAAKLLAGWWCAGHAFTTSAAAHPTKSRHFLKGERPVGGCLDLNRIGLGHSAGGQLVGWFAAQRGAAIPLSGFVSQGSVLDLVREPTWPGLGRRG